MKTVVLVILSILMVLLAWSFTMLIYLGVKEIIFHYKHRGDYKILESQLNNILQKQPYQPQSQLSSNASKYSSNVRKHWLKLSTYSDSIGSRTTPFLMFDIRAVVILPEFRNFTVTFFLFLYSIIKTSP